MASEPVTDSSDRTATAGVDPSTIDARMMAKAVSETSDKHLREGMRGDMRRVVLDEIFKRFPDYVDRDKIRDVSALIRWKVTGREDGDADRYSVVFDHGTCTASNDPGERPRVTFEIDGVDLLKLVTGNANPMILFGTGRIRVRGDLLFAARVAGFFTIPTAASE